MKYQTEILNTRQKTHGDYDETAEIAQALKAITRNGSKLPPVARESLDMIMTKIARILSGNPDEMDHWDDIAGYAKLVSERLTASLPLMPMTGVLPKITSIAKRSGMGDEVRVAKAVDEAMAEVEQDLAKRGDLT
jgi:hypothetical protein